MKIKKKVDINWDLKLMKEVLLLSVEMIHGRGTTSPAAPSAIETTDGKQGQLTATDTANRDN